MARPFTLDGRSPGPYDEAVGFGEDVDGLIAGFLDSAGSVEGEIDRVPEPRIQVWVFAN